MVVREPVIAYAVHCLSLYDQLELTLELLQQDDWPQFDDLEPLPPNVDARRRAELAIHELVVEQRPVNVSALAEHAGVSKT